MKMVLRQWQVAYRILPEKSIFNDKKTPFISIPNTKRYTAADPFLFTDNDTIYLFAELLDVKENLGKIGYCVFDGKGFSEWKMVISENYHLSYPNIFKWNGEIYIVPEANESNEIYVYRAVSFPDNWEKVKVLVNGGKFVDTTFLNYNGKYLMFTYNIYTNNDKKLYVYEVDETGEAKLFTDGYISNDDGVARPGGNFIEFNGDVVRVSQDCNGDYGKAVVFSKVKYIGCDGYKEEIIEHISPDDIVINERNITGIHTYNGNEILEVIDIHKPDYRNSFGLNRIIRKLGLKWKKL